MLTAGSEVPSRVTGASMDLPPVRSCSILGMRVDEVNYDLIVTQVRRWAHEAASRYCLQFNRAHGHGKP